MVRKPDIQYIHQFYVHGSEARALELQQERENRKKKFPQPKFVRDDRIRITVDPIALAGIVVAAAMLVLLLVGSLQYLNTCKVYQQMTDYVITLQNKNVVLEQQYEEKYVREEVEKKARALGMIPASEAEVITISAQLPEPEPEMTIWEEIVWFFEGLFA